MPHELLTYFDRWAHEYDELVQHLIDSGYDILAEMVDRDQIRPDWQVLDLGCGSGGLTVAVAPLVARVVAVDMAPNMIAHAARRQRAAGLMNVTFAVADAEALPFADGSFDLILAQSVLQFVDLARVLPVLRRLLRPGGQISISVKMLRGYTAAGRLHTSLARLRSTVRLSRYVGRAQGRRSGWRNLFIHLRHNIFSQRFDANRLDLETAKALFQQVLPGCHIVEHGRYMKVRWPG